MKKLIALTLALIFVCGAALSENKALNNWVEKYNLLARKNGCPLMDLSKFEAYEDGDAVYNEYVFDNDLSLFVDFYSDGRPKIFGLDAKTSDERAQGVLSCALAAADEKVDFAEASRLFKELFSEASKDGETAYKQSGSWYFVASVYSDERGQYITVGFGTVDVEQPSSDTAPGGGSIWEGLDPDDDTPSTTPTPAPTPKNEKGRYKA